MRNDPGYTTIEITDRTLATMRKLQIQRGKLVLKPKGTRNNLRLTTRVRLLLSDQGYPFARFKVDVVPRANETASLVVNIEDEGTPVVLGKLLVKGLERHSKEQLMSFLGLKPGMPLDAQVYQDVHAKLRNSCRFWHYMLLVRLPPLKPDRYSPLSAKVDLGITLVEYDRVPLLGEPLTNEEKTLKKAARWLETYLQHGTAEVGDMVIEASEDLSENFSSQNGTKYRLILSPENGSSTRHQLSSCRSDHYQSLLGGKPRRAQCLRLDSSKKNDRSEPSADD